MNPESHQPNVQQVPEQAEAQQCPEIGARQTRPTSAVALPKQGSCAERHDQVPNEQEATRCQRDEHSLQH